uniref:F-box domain-containing protein n=1 Tax=Mycena chlorophos TaxID=658473 RepID=A0ABQ0L602_MYCCL|nr:predicted protein [Mycena chlorophos]
MSDVLSPSVSLSPVYSIPNDLLYQFFTTALASEPLQRVISLSHVCFAWRDIIHNAPVLWTTVTINLTPTTTKHELTVQQLFRRSQNLFFDLVLTLRSSKTTTYSMAIALAPHLYRLRRMRVLAQTMGSLSSVEQLFALHLPSLERREIIVQDTSIPGSVMLLSTLPQPLRVTAISFSYFTGISFTDMFRIVETASATVEHLKLYFQSGREVHSPQHWELMHGLPVELPALISLQLGFNDALSLVPFLNRIRLPSLQSLSIHDLCTSPEPDTPQHAAYASISSSNPPLHELLLAVLEALAAPSLLKVLRLTGLYIPPEDAPTEDIIEYFFAICGPHLRTLRLAECDAVFLDVLAETLFQNHGQWRLEVLEVRGMDNDDLLECLWIRHVHEYPKLKELRLQPYPRLPPSREVLEHFADVVVVE